MKVVFAKKFPALRARKGRGQIRSIGPELSVRILALKRLEVGMTHERQNLEMSKHGCHDGFIEAVAPHHVLQTAK